MAIDDHYFPGRAFSRNSMVDRRNFSADATVQLGDPDYLVEEQADGNLIVNDVTVTKQNYETIVSRRRQEANESATIAFASLSIASFVWAMYSIPIIAFVFLAKTKRIFLYLLTYLLNLFTNVCLIHSVVEAGVF